MRRLKSRTHISKLVYSPDSRYLFSIGGKSTAASVWDLQAGKVVQKIYMPPLNEYSNTDISNVLFCSPNKLILVPKYGSHPLRIWDWPVDHNALPTLFDSTTNRRRAITVLGHTQLLISNFNDTLIFWNPVTNHQFEISHSEWRSNFPVEISNDGTLIAWSNHIHIDIYGFSDQTTFQIKNTPMRGIYNHRTAKEFFRFHPTGKLIASTYNNVVIVFDIATNKPISPNLVYDGKTTDVAFTPDGSKLLLLTEQGILHIWNANTYEEIATYDFGVKSAKCLAVSPDSLTCAIGGGFLEIVIVDLE